jgi:hypothetical protein
VREIFQPGMHPGTHPEADQLSTFVEGAASAHEREAMLAHLAVCAECRRVVFLMQEQADTRPSAPETAQARRWPWMMPVGLVGAALACGLAVVVYVGRHPGANQGAGEIEDQNTHVQAPAVPPVAPKTEAPAATGGQGTASREGKRSVRKTQEPPVVTDGVVVKQADKLLGVIGGLANTTATSNGKIAEDSPAAAAAQAAPAPLAKPEAPQMPLSGKNTATGENFVTALKSPVLRVEKGRRPEDGMSAVTGRVTDQAEAVVAGATVTLSGAAGKTQQTKSNADGSFSLAGVPPGHYELQVMAPGFETYRQAMDLKPRDVATLDTKLTVGSEAQTVTVQASAMPIETADASVNSVEVAQLPSGMSPQTTVVLGKHQLALDSAGTLFVSHDGSKHWKKVKPQWAGKVARIESADAENARTVFQLTTDSGALWISDDGTHWRAR